jgi:hypothetical protein
MQGLGQEAYPSRRVYLADFSTQVDIDEQEIHVDSTTFLLMNKRLMTCAAAIVVFASAFIAAAPSEPSLRQVVDRASRWVEQFEGSFVAVVADEQYQQFAFDGAATEPSHRQIDSELLFLRPEAGENWMAVRNVLSYADDGEPPIAVPNSRDRLTRALGGGRSAGRTAVRRLADESARFNIGGLARNFNTPTFALQFLDKAHRDRFRFRLEARDKISGQDVWRVSYKEREHPTIVQANFSDTELTGRIWTQESDGAVLRTRLELTAKPRAGLRGLETVITVDYRRDEKLDRVVPASMQEDYVERDGSRRVSATAVYSNYRVFETSARIVTPE